jgi:hypothetical protein
MKQISLAIFLFSFSAGLAQTGSQPKAESVPKQREATVHQLRIYEIPRNKRQVFNERFKDHAMRIMKMYDFHIVATWETEFEDKLEFVYLLEWRNHEIMEKAWENFRNDQEWKDIKVASSKVNGTFVDRIEDRVLTIDRLFSACQDSEGLIFFARGRCYHRPPTPGSWRVKPSAIFRQ